jgi:hypothetical protein
LLCQQQTGNYEESEEWGWGVAPGGIKKILEIQLLQL